MNISLFFFDDRMCLRKTTDILPLLKKNNVVFLSDTIKVRSFTTLLILGLMTLTCLKVTALSEIYKLQIVCFGFLSSIVQTLYDCYTHSKTHAQYDLFDSVVY